jgi:PBP1b-binding outer membrane lipoprotein LpoB
MKNLLPVLALLLLVGCTSEPTPPTELERCIEANLSELTLTDEEVIYEDYKAAFAISDTKSLEREQELEAWYSSEIVRLSQTTMEEVVANPSMFDDVEAEYKKNML